MLSDAIPQRSRLYVCPWHTDTKGQWQTERCGRAFLTPCALTCGSLEANHLFLASEIMKGRNTTWNKWNSITLYRDRIILTFYNILSSSGGRNSSHTSLWEFQSLLTKLDQWPKSRLQTFKSRRKWLHPAQIPLVPFPQITMIWRLWQLYLNYTHTVSLLCWWLRLKEVGTFSVPPLMGGSWIEQRTKRCRLYC